MKYNKDYRNVKSVHWVESVVKLTYVTIKKALWRISGLLLLKRKPTILLRLQETILSVLRDQMY